MPSRNTRSTRALGPAAAASGLVALVIVLGSLIMFAPGIRGNAGSFLVAKRRPFTSVADALPPNRSLKDTAAFTLRPHQRACMSSVTLPRNSGIALLRLVGSEQGHPSVALQLSAPGYRSVATLAAGEYARALQFHLQPPSHTVIGDACVLDHGPTPLSLEGTTDPRYTSRSVLTIDGRPVGGNLTLSFFERRRASQLERLGETFAHISNLTDHLIPVWLIWILIPSALVSVTIGIVAAFHRSLSEDEAASRP